eukprot:UN19167
MDMKGFRYYIYGSVVIIGGMGYGYINELPFSGYVWVAPILAFCSAETAHNSFYLWHHCRIFPDVYWDL